ncbi:endosome-associated-trafficking regulator 1 isoform X2 [Conger conger]|uniref:endosome-associated-trafficking regulator 1 isoform X2 n=1 Tax=Conger conger TaxID=82655 RepID=UPI002A59CE8D|nr:endosome-associated-trafficking regulator 1 isoform X2 [Conger conger]
MEFVRSKNLSSVCSGAVEEQRSHQALKKTGSESVQVDEEVYSSLKHCAPTLLDPFLIDSAPFQKSPGDERTEWRESYEPSSIQETHEFELCETMDSKCTDPPCVSTEEGRDTTILAQVLQVDREYFQDACEPKRSLTAHARDQETPIDDISCQTKQCSTTTGSRDQQKLREENAQLRNHVKELLKKSQSDDQRIKDLKEQLHEQKAKEEREALALETMVQSVEQNLQKMTKRAVKAETNASKLKEELLQLQDQLEVYRSGNERLRAAETTALNTMKQNAQVASEYLSKAANNAQMSIRQLLSEAETLSLVSKMLCSMDKISRMDPEDC